MWNILELRGHIGPSLTVEDVWDEFWSRGVREDEQMTSAGSPHAHVPEQLQPIQSPQMI